MSSRQAPLAPGETAADRTAETPHRRIVAVDEDGRLPGLLCLNASRTNFCR